MARATTPKGPKPHESKWTLVFTTKLRRFDTLQEAEAGLEKALLRGDRAYIQPPRAAWAGQVLTCQAGLVDQFRSCYRCQRGPCHLVV